MFKNIKISCIFSNKSNFRYLCSRYLVDPCYENVPKKADHPEKKCEPAPLKRCRFITDQAWTTMKDPKKLSNRCACLNLPPKEACTSCFDSPTPLHAPRLRRNWPDK